MVVLVIGPLIGYRPFEDVSTLFETSLRNHKNFYKWYIRLKKKSTPEIDKKFAIKM